ncbi:PilZ domain-containing protein [Thiohalorhabdus sp.]|uniref:PilZ domain-containing protein n=1 Tax=Thiohalorhabdus sp. TaxID=3094134 RepID=UPI002FC2D7A7
MSEDGNNPGAVPTPSGVERREHFRINTEIRLSILAQDAGTRRPWAFAENENISSLIGPRDDELAGAYQRLRGQRRRQTNLSAGGMRAGFPGGDSTRTAPNVTRGDQVSVLLELSLPEEKGFTLVHTPARVVWVDQTLKWQYVGCQFGSIPTGIERLFSQFVMEVERRRLRPT